MDFTKIFIWGGLVPALILFAGLCGAWLIVFIGRRAGERSGERRDPASY